MIQTHCCKGDLRHGPNLLDWALSFDVERGSADVVELEAVGGFFVVYRIIEIGTTFMTEGMGQQVPGLER